MKITGLGWPLKFVSGRLKQTSDLEHIRDNIKQIIGTDKFEYIMKPDFGCSIHQRIFDPVNVVALVEDDIKEAIAKWESRAGINNIMVDLSDSNTGAVKLSLDFFFKSFGQGTSNVEISVGG